MGEVSLEKVFLEAVERASAERLAFNALEPRADDTGFAVPVARFGVKVDPRESKLWLFGAGKASIAMARGALAKLGPQVVGGVLIAPDNLEPELERLGHVLIARGTHPIATSASVGATHFLKEAASRLQPKDHAIVLLSGGASALLCEPVPGVSLETKTSLVSELMAEAAPIEELNVVRKHLSAIKGGQLAAAFRSALIALVLSDVATDDPAVIGSGPLAPDPSTKAEAREIISRRLGEARAVELESLLRETPKHSTIRHVVIGNAMTLAKAAAAVARESGVAEVEVQVERVTGTVEELALRYEKLVRARLEASHRDRGRPMLIIACGEPTVRMSGPAGMGGRSQHLALLLAQKLAGLEGWQFLAAGSDGIDGNTSAAGAVVDGAIWRQAQEQTSAGGLNPLAGLGNYDSHRVLRPLNALINSGPTGNNLQDLHLLLLR